MQNDYYGKDEASLGFLQLLDWLRVSESDKSVTTTTITPSSTQESDWVNTLRAIRKDETLGKVQYLQFKKPSSTKPIVISISSSCDDEVAAVNSAGYVPPRRPSHPSWIGRHVRPCGESSLTPAAALNNDVSHPAFVGYQWAPVNSPDYDVSQNVVLKDIVEVSRNFSIDITHQAVLASGWDVDLLIHSGVARYVEFKAIERIFIARQSINGSASEDAKEDFKLEPVPCSRADVFSTCELSLIEKRLMMKFLRLSQDWGLRMEGKDVMKINEGELGTGRSLKRPQNKDMAIMEEEYNVEDWLDRPFSEFAKHVIKVLFPTPPQASCKSNKSFPLTIRYIFPVPHRLLA